MTKINPPKTPATDKDVLGYLRTFSAWAAKEFRDRMPLSEGVHELLLVSPDGSVFSVTVGDDGSLTATKKFDNG